MTYQIESGVPVPPRANSVGGKWYRLVRKMRDGDSVLVQHAQEQRAILRAFQMAKVRCVSRKIDGEGIRVWRLS